MNEVTIIRMAKRAKYRLNWGASVSFFKISTSANANETIIKVKIELESPIALYTSRNLLMISSHSFSRPM